MNNFFMLTRGRTGSSAIIDELGTANISSQQELFADFSSDIAKETLKYYSKLVPPFGIWKEILLGKDENIWGGKFLLPPSDRLASEKMLCFTISKLYKAAPFMLQDNWLTGRGAEKFLIGQYLNGVERQACENKKSAFIFKVLSHHLITRRSLLKELTKREYRALFLIRKNVVRQALSGLIAEGRSAAEGKNLYNKKMDTGEHTPVIIDVDKFERCVAGEINGVANDRSLLEKSGIGYLEISYEDFCEKREEFYSEIFSFMGIDDELPKPTDFSIMVQDIRKAVANFEDLEARVAMMGMKGAL